MSSDNGNNWNAINNGLTTTNIWSLIIKDDNIFAGTDMGVFLSTDNGENWTNMNNGFPSNVDIVSFAIQGNTIYAGTWSKGIFRSSDNGENWEEFNEGYDATYTKIIAISGKYLYAGTNGSGVWKRDISGVGINEFKVQSSKFKIDCYPNPANSLIVISCSLIEKGNVKIGIYDMMGMKVDELDVSQAQQDKIKYDTGKLRSGMYFVKVETGKGVETGKFVKN
jgi:hypothetical protein